MALLEKINNIIKKVQEIASEEAFRNQLEQKIVFSKDESYFAILNYKDIADTKKITQELWQELDSKVLEKIYYGYFLEKFYDFIANCAINKNHNITQKEYDSFRNQFNNISMQSYTMISRLYGISLQQNNDFIELGNFTICNYSHYRDVIQPNLKIANDMVIREPNAEIANCILIHNDIQAMNIKKAEFVFFDKIEKFINAILYCCAFITEDNAKISYKAMASNVNYIAIQNSNLLSSFSLKNDSLLNPLYTLSNDFFEQNNFKPIFQYIDEDDDLTELEKRIKMAINWIGQSLRNNDLTQRYTFLCIALETLLSNKPKGIMDYGITYRLREYSAYLAADDSKKRKEIYERINDLYNIRSEISHSGIPKSIKLKDYYDLLDIIYLIIKKLIKLIDEKENFETSKNLTDYINHEKGIG